MATNGVQNVVRSAPRGMQFGLAELLELVTLCAILAALSPATGVPASLGLMLLALGLTLRMGALALAGLAASLLLADWKTDLSSVDATWPQAMAVYLAVGGLCCWYRVRVRLFGAWTTVPARQ